MPREKIQTAILLSLSIARRGTFISLKPTTDFLFIPSLAKFFNFLRLHSTPPPYVFNVRVTIRNVLLVFPLLSRAPSFSLCLQRFRIQRASYVFLKAIPQQESLSAKETEGSGDTKYRTLLPHTQFACILCLNVDPYGTSVNRVLLPLRHVEFGQSVMDTHLSAFPPLFNPILFKSLKSVTSSLQILRVAFSRRAVIDRTKRKRNGKGLTGMKRSKGHGAF